MVADSRQLLDGLVEYRKRLEAHLRQLNDDFNHLDNDWRNFSAVYEGDAAAQFRAHWTRTADYFRDYTERTQRIVRLLDERIARLQQVNRTDTELT